MTWSIEECWHKLTALPCRAVLTVCGKHFGCDNTAPQHETHTSAALRARWVDTEEV
jgi:hypothetical protein